jgi:hypothetical protein
MSQSRTRRDLTYIQEENVFVFLCPNCDGTVIVHQSEINCQIFRHAILKDNGQQVNPHLCKSDCDHLYKNNLIYGCGKPFRIFRDNENSSWNYVDICDYI